MSYIQKHIHGRRYEFCKRLCAQIQHNTLLKGLVLMAPMGLHGVRFSDPNRMRHVTEMVK